MGDILGLLNWIDSTYYNASIRLHDVGPVPTKLKCACARRAPHARRFQTTPCARYRAATIFERAHDVHRRTRMRADNLARIHAGMRFETFPRAGVTKRFDAEQTMHALKKPPEALYN